MVRTMLESLVSERGGKRPPRKDLDDKHLWEIDNFHKMSFFWSYLLNFTGEYCKPKNLSYLTIIAIIAIIATSDLTIIATSDLRPHNNSYNSDSEETTQRKTLLKLKTIFLIALYVIYKLKRNR